MRIATAWFLSVTLALIGCSSSKKSNVVLDAAVSGGGCVPDDSKGGDSAIALQPGAKASGQICPRGDQDFYSIDVAAGMNLLDVSLSYPSSVTKVSLQVRLLEADGVTEVPGAVASDTNANDGASAVATTFAIPQPGRYVLRVSDASNAAYDNMNFYVLQATPTVDPDTHEPNGTAALAKPADGLPGFISYVGDTDVYAVTLAATDSILVFQVKNPKAAKAPLTYQIADSTGKVLGTGQVPAADTPLDLTQAAPGTGTLFVSFAYPDGADPDHRPEAGYTVTLGGRAEKDANEIPIRNDTPATATCLAGAGSPCAAAYSGAAAAFKTQTGYIGSRGDRDVFFLRATSAPGVVEAKLRIPATAMDLALDIVESHPASPCKADTDCSVMKVVCTEDDDCEWSHKCVNATAGACTTTACRQCVAANLCLALPDSPGQSACGVTLFSTGGIMKTQADGSNLIQTAQPIFNAGPVYVVVHDNKDDQYDPNVPYTLDVRVAPEPDTGDASADPAARNNYYNPYPIQTTNLEPNKARAKDITAQIKAGTSITGYISYQSDEDWYWFSHPCPGQDCGLVFEYVQPGPSPVQPVFFMRNEDLTLHESWTYTGALPTPAPVTDVFGDGDCTECSFASKLFGAPDDAGPVDYRYYLQVRDLGADDWDFAASGRYEFRLKTVNPGCPASCSEMGAGTCGCFCKAQNLCPAGLAH
jgi:hypothetical protein